MSSTVAKKKKYTFKKAKSQADYKRLLELSHKLKQGKEYDRIKEEFENAHEDVKSEKHKKRQHEKDLKDLQYFFDPEKLKMAEYDPNILEELYQMSREQPARFTEILDKKLTKGLKKKLDELNAAHIQRLDQELERRLAPRRPLPPLPPPPAAAAPPADPAAPPVAPPPPPPPPVVAPAAPVNDQEIGNIVRNYKQAGLSNKKIVQRLPALRDIIRHARSLGHRGAFALNNYLNARGIFLNIHSDESASQLGRGFKEGKLELKGMDKLFQDTAKRFNVLIGEISAGNTSQEVKDELYEIADFLLKNKKISGPDHKKIVKAMKLNDIK